MTPMTAVRSHVIVHGRVQGVFFRYSCQREARSAGVSGWVRNLDDGTVEAVFEGRPQDVDYLVAWCRKGPPAARVSAVDVTKERPEGLRGFTAD
jgi:acylphosphatase